MSDLGTAFESLSPTPRLPALFVGHGSPMNAIEDTPYSRRWREIGAGLPTPKAILVISAHWMTRGVSLVNVTSKPTTIHDFGGFPDALYAMQYPAPGAPDVARAALELIASHHGEADSHWGLDHGAWSVLVHLFPKANIPVFQLSVDLTRSPEDHVALARDLGRLRERGVLIVGSGNLVHNLRAMSWNGKPYDWALEFDAHIADAIAKGDVNAVAAAPSADRLFRLAHPSPEHFLPALYPLAVAAEGEEINFFNEGIDLGSVSMRSFLIA